MLLSRLTACWRLAHAVRRASRRRTCRTLLVVLVASPSACIAPATQMGSLSPEQVKAEQLRQQQLVITAGIREQQRLEDVGFPLLGAAAAICGPEAAVPRAGIRFANLQAFNKDYQEAARSLGFSDTLMVVGVTRGSAAEHAGIVVGERIVRIGTRDAPRGRNAVKSAGEEWSHLLKASSILSLGLRQGSAPAAPSLITVTDTATVSLRDSTSRTVLIPADTACGYGLVVVKDDALNAFADGKNVYVTSAMLRFAGSDEELGVVTAHEIAHNAMRHMDAKKKNATLGAIFGALLDVAAATQGVNTGGEFTNDFAAMGSQVFSQDFEREADYVGMYILARANRPIAGAPDFWRRMAQESPGSIKFASTHPTTAERFVRLDAAVKEIETKRASGQPLLPEMKKP